MSWQTDHADAGAKAKGLKSRRVVVRAALLALYIGLTVFVFINGRSHTFLLDNKSMADGSLPAFRRVKVYVGNHPPKELYARDRELLMVRGQGHRIRIETQEGAKTLEARFRVPFGVDMVLISVPKMAAGASDFWEEFVIQYERPTNNEAPPSLEDPVSIEPKI